MAQCQRRDKGGTLGTGAGVCPGRRGEVREEGKEGMEKGEAKGGDEGGGWKRREQERRDASQPSSGAGSKGGCDSGVAVCWIGPGGLEDSTLGRKGGDTDIGSLPLALGACRPPAQAAWEPGEVPER